MLQLNHFLDQSKSPYHAVRTLLEDLKQEGYLELQERSVWTLEVGGKYFVCRGGTALIAFRVPSDRFDGILIGAGHSDCPTFRLKEPSEMEGPEQYLRVNAEVYGSAIRATWLDRPLTVAGRVLVQNGRSIESRLCHIEKDLFVIPHLAPHMNPNVNDGMVYDLKTDMVPLAGQGVKKGALKAAVAANVGCKPEEILGVDLNLCPRQNATVWGLNDEFVSSFKLDDLQCVYGCYNGFLAAEPADSKLPVFAMLDREEVGNLSAQGADGTFLEEVAQRICGAFGKSLPAVCANSFMVSADSAHAVHPNHPEYADPNHRPLMNGGVVIKFGKRYATDGLSKAIFAAICEKAGVPVQLFANRSDIPGGGTLGNASNSHLSMVTVDIGLPLLGMHSCFETGGVRDADYLVQAMKEFYSTNLQEQSGDYRI